MSRIVVTGATGLLGSSLVPSLEASGHVVVRLRREQGARGTAELSADLADASAVGAALTRAAPDIIINLAALTNVDECERDPAAAYAGNTLVAENLVRWIEMHGGDAHLVQVSTDQVYDGTGPHAEDRVRPINYYSYSKLGAELAALRVSATILRTNLFGRSRAAGRASLSDWLVDVMRRRTPARVFVDVLFSPLSLDTLARYIEFAAQQRVRGVFNLGSRNGMSKADFAFRLADALGLKSDLLTRTDSGTANLAARRPLDMRMDCSRFEERFGIVLPTLESEIKSMRQVYENAT